MKTYSEIWERNGRWLMGPGLLGDIIEHLKGRAPIATPDPHDPHQVNVGLPLPSVTDYLSGVEAGVYAMIPEELRVIFVEQCNLIMRDWVDDKVDRIFQHSLKRQNTAHTFNWLNAELAHVERERVARDEDMLWVIAANRFGFSRYAVPRPAGVARSR